MDTSNVITRNENMIKLIPNSDGITKEDTDKSRLYKKIINMNDITLSCMLVVCHSWFQSKISIVKDELETIIGIEMVNELYNNINNNEFPFITASDILLIINVECTRRFCTRNIQN